MIWMPILFVAGMLVGVALVAWLDARGDRVAELNLSLIHI